MSSEKIILTDSQKVTLEFYLYSRNDYDLAFDYLKKLGVEKSNYNEVIKQLNS